MTDKLDTDISNCLALATKADADGDMYISKPTAIPLIKKLLLSEIAKATDKIWIRRRLMNNTCSNDCSETPLQPLECFDLTEHWICPGCCEEWL